jgi:hypothetical protein
VGDLSLTLGRTKNGGLGAKIVKNLKSEYNVD